MTLSVLQPKPVWIVAILLLAFSVKTQAARGAVFFSLGSEKIRKVQDFPDTDAFFTPHGSYLDAGCIFKQASIFFIPVWNYDLKWCGYIGENDAYLDLTEADLKQVAAAGGVEFRGKKTLPFWDAYGGKILLVVLVGGYLWVNSGTEE